MVGTMVSHVPEFRVLPSSQSHWPLPNIIGLRDNTRSNNIRRKVSFECSITCQL